MSTQINTVRVQGANLERHDARVIAWDTGNVSLCVDMRSFGLHLTISPDEARALATTLLGIADQAEKYAAALATISAQAA